MINLAKLQEEACIEGAVYFTQGDGVLHLNMYGNSWMVWEDGTMLTEIPCDCQVSHEHETNKDNIGDIVLELKSWGDDAVVECEGCCF